MFSKSFLKICFRQKQRRRTKCFWTDKWSWESVQGGSIGIDFETFGLLSLIGIDCIFTKKFRTLDPHPSRVLLELILVFQVSRIWKEMCGDWCSSFSEPWQEQRRVPDEKWNVKIASKSDKRTGEYDRKPWNRIASSVDAITELTDWLAHWLTDRDNCIKKATLQLNRIQHIEQWTSREPWWML